MCWFSNVLRKLFMLQTPRINEICNKLWCGNGNGTIYARAGAWPFTSCGDKKVNLNNILAVFFYFFIIRLFYSVKKDFFTANFRLAYVALVAVNLFVANVYYCKTFTSFSEEIFCGAS